MSKCAEKGAGTGKDINPPPPPEAGVMKDMHLDPKNKTGPSIIERAMQRLFVTLYQYCCISHYKLLLKSTYCLFTWPYLAALGDLFSSYIQYIPLHCKKGIDFPAPAGMSPTKVSLPGNN